MFWLEVIVAGLCGSVPQDIATRAGPFSLGRTRGSPIGALAPRPRDGPGFLAPPFGRGPFEAASLGAANGTFGVNGHIGDGLYPLRDVDLYRVDATAGQNGLQQARLFGEAVEVTGVVLTKLDGSAKGGIAVAIAYELGLPVKLVGVGERLDDLRPFDALDFARALVAG